MAREEVPRRSPRHSRNHERSDNRRFECRRSRTRKEDSLFPHAPPSSERKLSLQRRRQPFRPPSALVPRRSRFRLDLRSSSPGRYLFPLIGLLSLRIVVFVFKVFGQGEFLRAAGEAAEVVWRRGLLRRVGMCHGVSGNAHVFLSLYRGSGSPEHLYRARAFASFLLDRGRELIAAGEMHSGDRRYSLFEGQAGMAFLFFSMVKPLESRFPGYEV